MDNESLLIFKKRLLTHVNEENIDLFLEALIKTKVYVPVDKNNEVDFLYNEQKELLLPIYSSTNEIVAENYENFTWLNISINECLRIMGKNKEIKGIVLDPLTDAIEIKTSLLKLLQIKIWKEG